MATFAPIPKELEQIHGKAVNEWLNFHLGKFGKKITDQDLPEYLDKSGFELERKQELGTQNFRYRFIRRGILVAELKIKAKFQPQ